MQHTEENGRTIEPDTPAEYSYDEGSFYHLPAKKDGLSADDSAEPGNSHRSVPAMTRRQITHKRARSRNPSRWYSATAGVSGSTCRNGVSFRANAKWVKCNVMADPSWAPRASG